MTSRDAWLDLPSVPRSSRVGIAHRVTIGIKAKINFYKKSIYIEFCHLK
jgi:hypothetical protein